MVWQEATMLLLCRLSNENSTFEVKMPHLALKGIERWLLEV